jgi:hypothetical protein
MFFFNSGLSGTISGELEVVWTVQFFKNFRAPYFGPDLTGITGMFRIGDNVL